MNIKKAAVNALKFVRKFGMSWSGSGTSGLVRLADGTVEEQYIEWSRRGKVVSHRRVVSAAELAQWKDIGYLEDYYNKPGLIGHRGSLSLGTPLILLTEPE